jgi:hypothetical protein
MKTGIQIQTDIINLLQGSTLATAAAGGIYHAMCRPANSTAEDITVAFAEGTVGDIQTGTIIVNIYIPCIAGNTAGTWQQNINRCAELETAAALWTESFTTQKSGYNLALQQTISTQAIPDIQQHTIVVKLKYEYM